MNPVKSSMEISDPVLADAFGGIPGFYHGVASGDPMEDRVIVWTRYTPIEMDASVAMELRMAKVDTDLYFDAHLDPTLNPGLKSATVIVDSSSDFIAKVDVLGLESNTHYTTCLHSLLWMMMAETVTCYAFFSCAHKW